ncbi:nucleotidyltransferase domain-containing protein [Candidatus Woesearchaeota archaeon]|nr:nucleotidyltransferase domain-containing protein [Candidatus Woesearchaeota archaeon]
MVNKKLVDSILDKVLVDIMPSSDSLVVVNDFVNELNVLLEKKKVGAVAVLGGSTAKGTFLKDDFDADIFVKFDVSFKGKDISGLLASVLKDNFVFDRVRGSRDYFHVRRGLVFELVPVIDVSRIEDADNVIDMSPLHVDYFLRKGAGLEDDVRLLKRFMKSARVYGAESFIKGFSGHVVDLLVIKYGSFMNVLRAVSKWEPVVIIDIDKKLKDPLLELDKAKVSGPLVVVDPVQKDRNAATALSFDCFYDFVNRCKSFLESPSEDFFVLRSARDVVSPKKGESLFEFVIDPLSGSEDVSGSKVLKVLDFLFKELKNRDFLCSGFVWDFGFPCRAYFCVEDIKLDPVKVVRGPPLSSEVHCSAFRAKHKVVFDDGNFLFAKVNRDFVCVSSLFDFLIEDSYVLERCVSISYKKI